MCVESSSTFRIFREGTRLSPDPRARGLRLTDPSVRHSRESASVCAICGLTPSSAVGRVPSRGGFKSSIPSVVLGFPCPASRGNPPKTSRNPKTACTPNKVDGLAPWPGRSPMGRLRASRIPFHCAHGSVVSRGSCMVRGPSCWAPGSSPWLTRRPAGPRRVHGGPLNPCSDRQFRTATPGRTIRSTGSLPSPARPWA